MVSYQDDDRSYKVRRRFCFVVFQIALLCHTAVLGFSTLPSAIVQRSNNNNKFQYVSSGGSLADQHSCIRISVNLRASEEKEDEKERIKKSNQDSTAINTATDDTEGFSSDEAGENFSSKQNQLEQRPSSQPPEPTRDIRTEDLMAAMGTNPRRIFVGLLSGTGIALAGNFLGVTSKFLTALPESTVEASGLDTYFPRGKIFCCASN